MESIRLASADSIFPKIPCCRCGDQSRWWDRIAGKTYCPNCLEGAGRWGKAIRWLRAPTADAARFAIISARCATSPSRSHSRRPVEMELCSEHVRALVARRLGPHAFEQLRRQLSGLSSKSPRFSCCTKRSTMNMAGRCSRRSKAEQWWRFLDLATRHARRVRQAYSRGRTNPLHVHGASAITLDAPYGYYGYGQLKERDSALRAQSGIWVASPPAKVEASTMARAPL